MAGSGSGPDCTREKWPGQLPPPKTSAVQEPLAFRANAHALSASLPPPDRHICHGPMSAKCESWSMAISHCLLGEYGFRPGGRKENGMRYFVEKPRRAGHWSASDPRRPRQMAWGCDGYIEEATHGCPRPPTAAHERLVVGGISVSVVDESHFPRRGRSYHGLL